MLNEYIEKIPNVIHDTIFPMIIPEVYSYTIDRKKVLVVHIYPGSHTPYYLKSKGITKGTYVRIGRTNKIADEEMIKELERRKLNKSFDEDIYDVCNVEDEQELIEVLNNAFDQEITIEKIFNLGMIEELNSLSYLTNAAAIVMGRSINVSIKCARFLGESVVDFIDRKDYSGNIFYLLGQTILFLKNHLHNAGIIRGEGLKRKDILEVPEEVLREGILNAIIHRDYSIQGADIKVAVFDSKIEITSPGGFPKSLTVEEIYAGRSEVRNRIVANILSKSGYIELWGSGIPRIRELCRSYGLDEPEIEENGLFVTLRIYRSKIDSDDIVSIENLNKKSTSSVIQDEKMRIISLLESKSRLTVKEIASIIKIKETKVQRRLKALQEEDRITRIGSKKSGYWKVNL